MAVVGVARALQDVQPSRETTEQLAGTEQLCTGGRKLEGQGETVEPAHELVDVHGFREVGHHCACPVEEQRYAVRLVHGGQVELGLTGDAQRLATRDEQPYGRRGRHESGQLWRGCREELLDVVEHEVRASYADTRRHGRSVAARRADQLGHGGQQQCRVPEWRQRNEDRAAVRFLREQARELKRESRLPGATRPDDGKDARLALVPDGNRPEELALTAEEGGSRGRKVGCAGRSKWRELRVAELEDPHQAVEVLDAMLPQVPHRHAGGEERSSLLGDQNLTSMGEPAHAGATMDVHPHVPLGREGRCSRVKPHTYLDRADCQRVLPVESRIHSLACGREGDEERVALRVDLDPAVGGESLPQRTTVLGQRLRVRLRPERVKQPRRALDVGEEERDRAGREVGAHVD